MNDDAPPGFEESAPRTYRLWSSITVACGFAGAFGGVAIGLAAELTQYVLGDPTQTGYGIVLAPVFFVMYGVGGVCVGLVIGWICERKWPGKRISEPTQEWLVFGLPALAVVLASVVMSLIIVIDNVG